VDIKYKGRGHQDRSSRYEIDGDPVRASDGSGVIGLLNSVQGLQSSLPDDLQARREAAAEFLADRRRIEKDTALHSDTDYRLCNLWAGIDAGSEAEMCAAKRLSHIHTGDFSAESEYYPPEPDYPEQWLEYMSEESAEWLAGWLKEHAFGTVKNPQFESPPKELKRKDLVVWCRSHPEIEAYATRGVFLTGGLELPDFIDEEEL